MPLTQKKLEKTFASALPYADYLKTGTEEQQQRWNDVYNAVTLTDDQKSLLASFTREMKVLVSSGIWCGDCVLQGPMLQHIAEASDKIDLRLIDRDEAPKLRDAVIICAGTRVPVVIFMAEDYAPCSIFGDRTLSSYRRIAQERLGSACSTGLFVPAENELATVTAEWLNEFERIQLMLRVSSRLREKHND